MAETLVFQSHDPGKVTESAGDVATGGIEANACKG
jgi:hypothetical protein